jgi:hypothetical protein
MNAEIWSASSPKATSCAARKSAPNASGRGRSNSSSALASLPMSTFGSAVAEFDPRCAHGNARRAAV